MNISDFRFYVDMGILTWFIIGGIVVMIQPKLIALIHRDSQIGRTSLHRFIIVVLLTWLNVFIWPVGAWYGWTYLNRQKKQRVYRPLTDEQYKKIASNFEPKNKTHQ